MFNKQRWSWNFKLWSPTDYELNLVFNAEDRLFLSIYQAAKDKLEGKRGSTVGGDVGYIERFDIDERFYKLLKTYLKKPFNITSKDVLKEHGFKFVDYYVVKAWFERDKNKDWLIYLRLKGTYVKK